ncbi:MAG: response regulator [Silicimonas sp.]|jgi:ActR/RegA family two-component response regulator|nr:response regulator [Silicimonas sp.]
MPDTLEDLVMRQPPTAERPLLGTIILVVEDSRHACEAMRLICQRSGARIRRAESIASAERHLRAYRPGLAVVDLGLPDGSGLKLIEQLARGDQRIDGIIATSGDEALAEAALKSGADLFLPKPLASISQFQKAALSLLPVAVPSLKTTKPEKDRVRPDPIALRDDLLLAAELLRSGADAAMLDYVAGFLSGLAKCADHPRVAEFACALASISAGAAPNLSPQAIALEIEEEAATHDAG